MVNGVSVGEHTHNQIKESIRASAAVGELSIVISRSSLTFKDSIKNIEKGFRSGALVQRYDELPDRRQDLSRSTALMRENGWKNRYRDVLPYDDTRIKLTNNEYINASWIDIHSGGSSHRHWIAAQGKGSYRGFCSGKNRTHSKYVLVDGPDCRKLRFSIGLKTLKL